MTIVWLRALAVAAALGLLTFSIMAQGQKQAEGERRSKEVRLTEKLVQNFIAAQKLIAPIASKYEFADKVDPRVQSQVERIAKSNGFASLEELGDVSFTVSVVLAGLDRETGRFTDVPERIKKALEELKQGKQWPWSQEYKDQRLAQMQEDLKTAAPLQFKENVALVRKYQKQIDQLFEAFVPPLPELEQQDRPTKK